MWRRTSQTPRRNSLTFFDERFTTVTATEKLREAGKKAKHQKDIIDQAAALEILRDYLGW
ncbi:MAG: Holliday junction resolvase RuvX [Akkermansiaceae bacterium]